MNFSRLSSLCIPSRGPSKFSSRRSTAKGPVSVCYDEKGRYTPLCVLDSGISRVKSQVLKLNYEVLDFRGGIYCD